MYAPLPPPMFLDTESVFPLQTFKLIPLLLTMHVSTAKRTTASSKTQASLVAWTLVVVTLVNLMT